MVVVCHQLQHGDRKSLRVVEDRLVVARMLVDRVGGECTGVSRR